MDTGLCTCLLLRRSDIHFYFVHRVMHPWGLTIAGFDLGRFLFKHVHSYHHVAHNPGSVPSSTHSHRRTHTRVRQCTHTHKLHTETRTRTNPDSYAPPPSPWSGLAMHPVEHWAYFSRSLLLLVVRAHPWHFLFSNIRAQIGPAPGVCACECVCVRV